MSDFDKVVTSSMNSRAKDLTTEEKPPLASTHPPVWDLVMEDMFQRNTMGTERYGTPLKAHNGRDALKDAYQEALDLTVYLRQAIYERDGQ